MRQRPIIQKEKEYNNYRGLNLTWIALTMRPERMKIEPKGRITITAGNAMASLTCYAADWKVRWEWKEKNQQRFFFLNKKKTQNEWERVIWENI